MLWNPAALGPSQYATFIATINPDNNQETVGSVAKKLQNYESIISSPMQAQVSAVAKELREEIREKVEEMRRNSSQVAPVQVTGPRIRAQWPPTRERGYTPQADLWFFLSDHGEDMGRWDGKPTSAWQHGQREAQEKRVYWMVWIRWPGTSEPQKYEALVDTGLQCTLIPSEYVRTEPISIAGVTGGSQELTLLEAEVSLTGKEWQKHPVVTSPGAPHILGIDFLWNGYYKDSKGLRWAFEIAAVEAEGIKKLNSLPGLSENPSAAGLLKVEEQEVQVATSTVLCQQYQDAVIPIHKMIHELET
ncbi:hypothetical protein DUI87_05030 [Hirundo rustica rustica]|uniref:Peptidase A2 domain-containing protein n=1 Tax=Hirundo rustica rustica TaxID=333673 RepID=A0A3M0KXW9_HIRRU|nr:hypothetical protein DUI87_05030 [Hirundo rustica rustica]